MSRMKMNDENLRLIKLFFNVRVAPVESQL